MFSLLSFFVLSPTKFYSVPLHLYIHAGSLPVTEDLLCVGADLSLPGRCHHDAGLPPLQGPVCPRGGHHVHLPHRERAAGGGSHHQILARADGASRATQCDHIRPLTGSAQGLFW